jgi:hypothetical protein
MAALTAAADRDMKEGKLITLLVDDGDTIYKGALVMLNSAGYAVEGADTSGGVFMGVADETADNAAGADGAISIRVRTTGVYAFAYSGTLNQASIGTKCYIVDDNTVAAAATTTNDVLCGHVVGLKAAGVAWVRIDRAAGGAA